MLESSDNWCDAYIGRCFASITRGFGIRLGVRFALSIAICLLILCFIIPCSSASADEAPTLQVHNTFTTELSSVLDGDFYFVFDEYLDQAQPSQTRRFNENIITVLFLGVDAKQIVTQQDTNKAPHQSDVVLLVAVDSTAGTFKIITIPRDVVTEVDVFDASFRYCRTDILPLAVQYGYGDGADGSAKLSLKAVSKLLKGIPIERYVVMDLKGIKRAVNAVGGVELTILDDFSCVDSSMKLGRTMTLNGARAELYVRARESMPDSLNASRMRRQRQFLIAFMKKISSEVKENPTLLLSLYTKVYDSLYTNLQLGELIQIAKDGLSIDSSFENCFIELPVTDTSTESKTSVVPNDEEIAKLVDQVFYQNEN